ncbi:transposase [Candidatus Halobeggiatoa sp. HSG11]|nr:transposase [Candidatus Halobeggiatoa sp. HSG11]
MRDYGWAPKGEKIFGCRKGKREKNINIIAALNGHTIIAPLMYESTTNADLFNVYLEECLLPAVKLGQIIIMDNASFHKSIETESLIGEAGCYLLFLPAYSPELNPIEHK